ncbi:hypothetical protein ABZV58_04970 [Nocardia sp. NPDC004654]|uniref:hypothetical protein n=1 Tax=Nocardia sp. NPDC004654 TaxID=3154776 RepID=UPI0033A987B5
MAEQNPTTPGGNGLSVILEPAAIAAVNAESPSRAATENLGRTQEHVLFTNAVESGPESRKMMSDMARSIEFAAPGTPPRALPLELP